MEILTGATPEGFVVRINENDADDDKKFEMICRSMSSFVGL